MKIRRLKKYIARKILVLFWRAFGPQPHRIAYIGWRKTREEPDAQFTAWACLSPLSANYALWEPQHPVYFMFYDSPNEAITDMEAHMRRLHGCGSSVVREFTGPIRGPFDTFKEAA